VTGGVVYFGDDDDRIYALSTLTGKKLWMFNAGDEIASSPAVSGNTVYVRSL
jgi:outer membrane protein assembly factor BamB